MSSYNPNKQGWGFAAVVCLITAGLFFTAKTIHARTYRHPRDPMNEQVYRERDLEKRSATTGMHEPTAPVSGGASTPTAEPPAGVKH
jgi:hypothetical protein